MSSESWKMALAAGGCGFAVLGPLMSGCDNLARSQGMFPVATTMGSNVLGISSYPLDDDLYFTPPEEAGLGGARVPLVKIGYRHWLDGKLLNAKGASDQSWDKQTAYMVVDVTNVVRDPSLGAGQDEIEFKRRLHKIAELLLIAADWNGEVYWRHLTTFLDTYRAVDATARTAVAAGIAASFISPVLGATIAGGGLVTDTLVTELTGSLDAEQYAELRTAASTYRRITKVKIFEDIEAGGDEADAINMVLHRAYDYAYSYSIKGAVQVAAKQNTELQNLLITGESEWKGLFKTEIRRHQEQRIREGKVGPEELQRLEKSWREEAEKAAARKLQSLVSEIERSTSAQTDINRKLADLPSDEQRRLGTELAALQQLEQQIATKKIQSKNGKGSLTDDDKAAFRRSLAAIPSNTSDAAKQSIAKEIGSLQSQFRSLAERFQRRSSEFKDAHAAELQGVESAATASEKELTDLRAEEGKLALVPVGESAEAAKLRTDRLTGLRARIAETQSRIAELAGRKRALELLMERRTKVAEVTLTGATPAAASQRALNNAHIDVYKLRQKLTDEIN